MASYTIANQQIVASALLSAYAQAKLRHSLSDATDLDVIFKVALQNPDRFPGISINGVQNQLTYIDRWVKGYCEAQANRPSQRTATPKSACTDPAIAIIVQEPKDIPIAKRRQAKRIIICLCLLRISKETFWRNTLRRKFALMDLSGVKGMSSARLISVILTVLYSCRLRINRILKTVQAATYAKVLLLKSGTDLAPEHKLVKGCRITSGIF